jgi:serine/threonine protein kinase
MPAYMKNHSMNEINAFFKKQVHGYSSYLKRLLLRMIEKNYKKRPSFDEILCSNIDQIISTKEKLNNEFKLKRSNSF